MNSVCIIPARGGSKRIPRKNIKPFCGKPIICYTIEAALESGCFKRVIVSTDDVEIESVALNAGAEVPFLRPFELSNDHVTVLSSVKHAIQWMQQSGDSPDYVCLSYATAPFLRGDVFRDSFGAFTTRNDKSFCLAVTEFTYPIQRAVRMTSDGGMTMFQPEHFYSRSQDLVRAYHDAGQFCWGTPEAFVLELPVFERYTVPFFIPSYRVQDIDTMEDWIRAEALYRALSSTGTDNPVEVEPQDAK